nr:MAG TPA: hypothetical protein [Caudoviricetes sp.]
MKQSKPLKQGTLKQTCANLPKAQRLSTVSH